MRVGGEMPFDALSRAIRQAAPAMEETMATIEEQLIQRGREEGRQEGRESSLRAMLLRLLRIRFGSL